MPGFLSGITGYGWGRAESADPDIIFPVTITDPAAAIPIAEVLINCRLVNFLLIVRWTPLFFYSVH